MTQNKLLLAALLGCGAVCLYKLGLEPGQAVGLGALMLAIMLTFGAVRDEANGVQLDALRAKHQQLIEESQARVAELDKIKEAVLAHMTTAKSIPDA